MAKAEPPRHVKYRKQLGGKLPVPSRIDVHVIGSGGRATPRSVMISTDHVRYLFNCGEGTQRIATEHHLKVSRLENIFITNKTWDNVGGLLGLALTLEATHMPGFTIHGPPEVEKMILMVKGFAESSDIKVEKRELEMGYYEDSAFHIEYVPLYKHNKPPDSRLNHVNGDQMKNNDSDISGAPEKKRRLSTDKSEVVVAYICKPFPGTRKVLLENCVDLGVPGELPSSLLHGPLIGKLTSGETITLDDGRVITPDEILSPAEIPRPIIVLECPSMDYLDAVVSSEKFHEYQESGENVGYSAELIIHSTPAHVLNHPRYQEFIARFGSKTKHLILNETTSVLVHEGLYRVQAKLNLLHSNIFPLLPHQDALREDWVKPVTPEDGSTTGAEEDTNVVFGRPLLSYNYRPWKKFLWDQCLSLNNGEFVDEAMQQEDFQEKLQQLKDNVSNHSKLPEKPHPEVLFLGTGSSVPNKIRNVSCIVVHTDPDTCVLLDCGESSAAQIFRHYGSQADAVLQKIKAIYVSHMHADHHLGLFGVLSERQRALAKSGKPLTPILLLAPIQLNRWLQFYSTHIEVLKEHIRLIPLQKMLPHKREVSADFYETVLQQLKLKEFRPVEVDHVPNSFGIALTHNDGWKLVYSGSGCDLLIHEATMEDDLIEEAKFKKHSTTSEAIDIGMQMNAGFILLNHFSQRYHRIPVFNDNFSEKVGISYDNMRIRLSDLQILPYFIEPLKALFCEEYSDLADKTFKRTLRKNTKREESNREKIARRYSLALTLEATLCLDSNSWTPEVRSVNWKWGTMRIQLFTLSTCLCINKQPPDSRLNHVNGDQMKNNDSDISGVNHFQDQKSSSRELCRPGVPRLECPSMDYLDAVVSSEKFHEYQESGENVGYSAELIIHSTPAHVPEPPTIPGVYSPFLIPCFLRFGSKTKHLILNETTSVLVHEGLYRVQAKLNLLHSNIFPLLPHQDALREDWVKPVTPEDGSTTGAEEDTMLDQCLSLNNGEFVDEAMQQEDFQEKLQQLKDNSDTCVLLDCGESSAAQIFRHYGSQADAVLQKIKAIYVSHMHADHHLGLFGVLSERQRALAKSGKPLTPILLLAPIQLNRWLQFYSTHIEVLKEHIRLIPLQKMLPHKREVSADFYETVLQQLKLKEFRPVEVDHVPNSFGIALTHNDGWKLVYSGDTRPCQRLVQAGSGCDLLIHEATMEDDLIEEAKFKKHSTTSEAIDIGMQMNAGFILLNHFSQRYHRIPVFNDNFSEKVGISYDNMRIRLSDLQILPYFIEPLKALFCEEYSDLADKTFKRTQKKIRKEKKAIEKKSQEDTVGDDKNTNKRVCRGGR
ncbi:hypothetical protein ScPMuIL_004750 [Solemya velum]